MGVPLYVICCFSLVAFNILSLYLIFDSLINMCLVVSPWIYPVLDSLRFLDLISYILSHINEVFNYNLFKYFLIPFLFFFWDPYNQNVVLLMLSQRCLRLSSILFILFSLFFSAVVISTVLSSRSLIHSSASFILLLIPSREF